MNAAPPVKRHPAGSPSQDNWAATHKRRDLLLWYWSLAFPRRGKWIRTAYIQPALGVLMVILGVLVGVFAGILGWWSIPIIASPAIAVIGAAIVLLSYRISVYYSFEYPGRFDEGLEEYVARRVSRLSKDAFIPQYKTSDRSADKKINKLNRRVRWALKVEKLRLEHSDRTSSAPVCGILVVGPRHTNKTGALWDAMARELKGWTFVKWPHHMDHPANLADRLGHRIVLWIDDLHDFARPAEAAALAQFIEQLRASGQRFLVLASCRDDGREQDPRKVSHDKQDPRKEKQKEKHEEHDLQEAKRYFSPLIADLQQVRAIEELPRTQQFDDLAKAYTDDLSEVQRGVLRTMDWLQSLRVSTFPGEVLDVLNKYFVNAANVDGNEAWDAALERLGSHGARFVRVDQRVKAETRLSAERYDFGRWLHYNFFRNVFKRARHKKKTQHPDVVVEPLNVRYLNLEELGQEGTRVERARKITTILEQQPAAVIELLADHPVAAETLILLGDAYLNHLGETIDNASELAIECYAGALRILNEGASPEKYPGAWAAALIGKGTAELRVSDTDKADEAFSEVTDRQEPNDDARPIPPLLIARAWHGQGDVIAAKIPSADATKKLGDAASFYEKATALLPRSDPLAAEARLDRANILYEIAQAASKEYEQSLFSNPNQPPIDTIKVAQQAYKETVQDYPHTVAPTVWAEVERRQGDLCRMMATCLLPADMQLRPRAAIVGVAVANPHADAPKALDTAKLARDYFIAARNVFAPSYFSTSWAQTQMGLVRALLIIARIVAPTNQPQARSIYVSCRNITSDVVQKVYPRAEFPLDWVDLQVLHARAEIGLGALGDGGAPGQYQYAKTILKEAGSLLSDYMRLPGYPNSERITTQIDTMKLLGEQIKEAPPGP